MKTALLDFSLDELKEYVNELGEPAYRAGQIMSWMLRGVELDGMTNLPASLRERLSREARLGYRRDGKISLPSLRRAVC